MKTEIKPSEERVTAFLLGDIDHHNAKKIREEIDDAVIRCKPRELILDFGGVHFMDSSGIGLVLGRYRLMRELGGIVKIQNHSPQIASLLAMGGIENIIKIR